jgi:hypothetical protein
MKKLKICENNDFDLINNNGEIPRYITMDGYPICFEEGSAVEKSLQNYIIVDLPSHLEKVILIRRNKYTIVKVKHESPRKRTSNIKRK